MSKDMRKPKQCIICNTVMMVSPSKFNRKKYCSQRCGGIDNAFPHHTNEIAQSQACHHTAPVKYWMHTNMLTVNGVRMSKSAGNGFLPKELFTGNRVIAPETV